MSHIHVINLIEVPRSMIDTAISLRDDYVAYFAKQKGYISSSFYRSIVEDEWHKFVNLVVWDSLESFEAVVNVGFANAEGLNADGRKVLGAGFPPPIRVTPSRYELIRS